MNTRMWALRFHLIIVILALAPMTAFAAATGDVGQIPTQLLTISALVGMALPALIAMVNREKWSAQLKGLAALGLCLAAALLIAWWDASLDWHNARVTILAVIASALGMYHAFWKPTGIADSLSKATG